MKLTGECANKFEAWYKWIYLDLENASKITEQFVVFDFYNKKAAEQWGVYQLFFDSVGILLEVKVKPSRMFNYGVWDDTHWIISSEFFTTRPEARTAAIEKANDLINNKGI